MWGRVRTRIFRGLFVLVPLVVTLAVLRLLLGLMAGLLLPLFGGALESWPWVLREGIAVLILIAGLYLIGEVTTLVVGGKLVAFGEALLLRVPFVKVIYRSAKQVVDAVQTPRATQFKSVVAVRFPHAGMYSLGFLTGTIERPEGSALNTVFVPTTPNPTTGFLQIVPESEIIHLELTVEEAVRTIMSLGMLFPPQLASWIPEAGRVAGGNEPLESEGVPDPKPASEPSGLVRNPDDSE